MKSIIASAFLLLLFPAFSQTAGFYVDGFASILGDDVKEDSLLRFARNNGFTSLTLYQMHIVNAETPLIDFSSAQTFADFVEKARTQFDIADIGVAVENFSSVTNVYHVYNQQHPVSQKINVYNLEFEFWTSAVEAGNYYCTTYLEPNGYPCGEEGAFDYYCSILHSIDSLAALDGAESEAYLGWFDAAQGQRLVETGVDRILLSAYLTSANYSAEYQYDYLDSRLENLATAEIPIEVRTLHSAEPDFMQSWIETHEFSDPFNDFTTELNAETETWSQYIIPGGYQWFAYTDMPIRNMTVGLDENNKSKFCVFPNPSNGTFKIVSENSTLKEYEITDLNGKCFQKGMISGEIKTDLESGIYLLKRGNNVTKIAIE